MTSMQSPNGNDCGQGVIQDFISDYQEDDDHGYSDASFEDEEAQDYSSDGQSDHYGADGNDGDLNSGNEEHGGASGDEDEEETGVKMEHDQDNIKDVLLFPESIITMSDLSVMLSKSNRYDEDYPKPQPYQATISTFEVKSQVMGYITSTGRRVAHWIISAGITTVLLEIFKDSVFTTAQTLTTGHWDQDGPTLWTQADPHHHHITAEDWYPLPLIKGTVFTPVPTGSQEDKRHACSDIWVWRTLGTLQRSLEMSPVMLGSLAANAFPSQMYGTKLKVFWTGTPDKVDDRVMTRRTYGDCPTQSPNPCIRTTRTSPSTMRWNS